MNPNIVKRRKATPARSKAVGKAVGADVRLLNTLGSERRSEILEAAARRIADHGFEVTTVRQIADDVGILSGSLYHHFATKDEMLHEVVRDVVEQMRASTLRIAGARAEPDHRLIALILLELGELTGNQKVHAILTNERRFFRQKPEFRYVVTAKIGIYRAWKKVLQDGIRAKQFRADTDVFLTILTVLRMLNNAADWFRNDEAHGFGGDSDSSYSLDKVIDFHLRFILSGIRTLERESAPIPRAECEALARGKDGKGIW
jgi:TetR/AcrR family transcriptional regulator, cholesterol catabolism regulator